MISASLAGLVLALARLSAWLVLLGLLFVPLERLFALRPMRAARSGLSVDLAYYFINGIVPVLTLSVPLAAVAWLGQLVMPPSVPAGFAHLPLALRVFLTLAIAEVGLYWGHRWCHEIPLLWRFHALHHSSTHVDWLVNSRGHPVDFIFTRLCGLVPLYMLGLASPLAGDPGKMALLVMLAGPTWGFLIHANLKWRFGPLEWLIASPAFHHWHHANDEPAVTNKNYAPMFPWIDRMFGTLHLPPDRQPAVYGTDTVLSPNLVGQLLDPFVPARVMPARVMPARVTPVGVLPAFVKPVQFVPVHVVSAEVIPTAAAPAPAAPARAAPARAAPAQITPAKVTPPGSTPTRITSALVTSPGFPPPPG